MSLPLVVNGTTYNYPEVDDTDWGVDATDWAQAVTLGMLQKAGGLFQLLAEVDFGTGYGVKSLYIKSRTANPADSGQIRLARADVINWRNQANAGNLSLGVSSGDVLQFNGVDIQNSLSVTDTSTIDLTFTSDTLSADIIAESIDNSLIAVAAGIVYSKLDLSDSIVNADINSSAAIAYSKLALTGSIVNDDVNASAAIAYSKLNLTGSIANADISATAAIDFSKLATLTSAYILVGSGSNVATAVAVTGDVTISNAGVTAIGANKVVNSMLAQMAQSTIKGRAAGAGTGDPVDLTATQATAILNALVGDSGSGGTKGLAPAPAAGDAAAGKFLKADGTWTAPAGAGDVVGPGSATDGGFAKFDGTTGKLIKNSAATISNSDVASNAAIDFSKLATLTAAQIIVGNVSNVPTAVAVTGDISLSNAGVTAYAGTVPLNKGGTGQTTKAPAFDALQPMDAIGQLIYGGASGTGTKLAAGAAGQVLQSAGGAAPVWSNPVNLQNFLVNSAFDYWQVGTSATVTATGGGTPTSAYLYQADQWYVRNILGGGTVEGIITYAQASGVTNGSKYGASVKITTAPTGTGIQNGCELWQTLSNFASLPLYGKSASFSVLVKAQGNVNQVGVQFFYATTQVKADAANAIGSEILTTVNSSTFTACTISGQALGTSQTAAGVIGVRIRITNVSSGNTYDVNNGFVCEQAMLNLGAIAAPFSRQCNNPTDELATCQEFLEKSYDLTVAPGSSSAIEGAEVFFNQTASTGTMAWNIRFKVTKIATPAITIYSPGTGTVNKCLNSAGSDLTAAVTTASPSKIGTNGLARM